MKAKSKVKAETISFPETTAYDTVKSFVDVVKNIKDNNESDIHRAFTLCQKTWVDSSVNKAMILKNLRDHDIIGNITIREKRKISDCCHIYEMISDAGKYSLKVIKETEPYKPRIEGTWGVNPLSFRKL